MVGKLAVSLVTAVIFLSLVSNRTSCAWSASSGHREGLWSSAAVRPVGDPTIDSIFISSPNGKAAVIYSGDGVYLRVGDNTTLLREVNETPALSEVLWAPDSKAFVISASDGGLVGTWHAHFYFIDHDGRPVSQNIARLVSADAESFAICTGHEEVNIGASGWLHGNTQLLVVAQVPPDSTCANMGAMIGFRIDVKTWKLKRVIRQDTLRSRFASFLGSHLHSDKH